MAGHPPPEPGIRFAQLQSAGLHIISTSGFTGVPKSAIRRKFWLGKGNQYRYILVKNKKDFPKAYITKLMRKAYVNSMAKVKDKKQITQSLTITKLVSEKRESDEEIPDQHKLDSRLRANDTSTQYSFSKIYFLIKSL